MAARRLELVDPTSSVDAFWVWHFANAYEEGERIIVDFPGWSHPGFAARGPAEVTGAFTRATIDRRRPDVGLQHLDNTSCEFPRINDRLLGQPHRYLTVGRRSDPSLVKGEHDVLVRCDMKTGTAAAYHAGASIGEVVFAPRQGSHEELDGYYLTFGTSLDDERSWLYVWDAEEFPSAPVARVLIPQRVPNGLHGNWFSAT